MTPVEQITSLYIGYFGRAPDPVGLNYWVGRLNDGFSLAEIAESFSVQPESQARYPYLANQNIASPQAFITQVYLNLFNRTPDAEGLAYWTAQLTDGGDVGDFILDVISGAVNNPADQAIIDNKIEVGVDFALETANLPGFVYNDAAAAAALEVINGVDGTEASVEAAKAETDEFVGGGVIGDTFTLTAALDQFVGTVNNDVFQGEIGSLNGFDSLQGGAGNDTLNLYGNGAAGVAATQTVQGIEIVNVIRDGAATGGVDASGFRGATQIWEENAAGGISGLSEGQTAGFRGVDGLDTTVAYGNAADNASIVVDNDTVNEGEGVTTIAVTGDGLDTVTISGSLETVEAEGGVGEIGPEYETLGTLNLDIDGAGSESGIETLNLTLSTNTLVNVGGGFSDIETINASSSTGAIIANLSGASSDSALTSVVTGSGDDAIGTGTARYVDDLRISTASGDDFIQIFAELDEDAEDEATTLTVFGGEGADEFVLSGGNVAFGEDEEGEATLTGDSIVIADFDADDVLVLADFNGFTGQNAVNNAVDGADSLAEAVAALQGLVGGEVEPGSNITNYAQFEFDGETYVYGENGGGALLLQVDGVALTGQNVFGNDYFAVPP